MRSPAEVRRVRLHEWAEIRDLRMAAVSDPDASLAFLTTVEQERERDDAAWRDRAAGAALGDDAAQFVAVDGGSWVGSVTVLLREAGDRDHLGRGVEAPRADVVGVFIAPAARGAGLLERLIEAAAVWAAEHGADALTLDVHRDNARARAAYRRIGFVPTGVEFTSVIGPEIEMRKSLGRTT
ncbi:MULTISPECIES: GNAT family N-acetyltransferase [unclassified Microbacterium]|uniref:GNAT family N-acetyltransferase n=1 Tax=unclassified Microbacterium TaxID=2609290 RepID=UPI000F557789|nr:GNAT family N-acetyltransferase [Microbacterium sp. ABRD28]AZC13944.1 N-acetyltransferase [Microbacterium sp. ABRD28]